MSLRIEWDVHKDQANRKKHRVSFSEASEIFLDPLIASVLDLRHPAEEMRFFSVGVTRAGRLLSVGHSDDGVVVRLITARDATARERRQYEEGH
jgi:uncharacterized DUF497 family protein